MIWTASTNRTRGTCGLEYLLAVPHAERGYLERLHGHGDDYSSLPVSSDASATVAVPCPILTSSPQPCILYEYHAADTAKQCHYSCSTTYPFDRQVVLHIYRSCSVLLFCPWYAACGRPSSAVVVLVFLAKLCQANRASVGSPTLPWAFSFARRENPPETLFFAFASITASLHTKEFEGSRRLSRFPWLYMFLPGSLEIFLIHSGYVRKTSPSVHPARQGPR